MTILNGFRAITLSLSLVALLGTGCSPVMTRPAPAETPAELVLPPTYAPGNLDRIRSDLLPFLRGNTHTHTRPATCSKCVVDVDIRSIGLTTDITPLIGPSRFRIVAWVKNKDPRDTETEYSLKPATEYLMWVAPAPPNRAGTSRTIWGLFELPAGSTGAIKLETIGYVKRCLHPKPPGAWKSDADFRECENAHLARPALRGQASATFAAFYPSSDGFSSRLYTPGPGWFDCGGFCCTGTKEQN